MAERRILDPCVVGSTPTGVARLHHQRKPSTQRLPCRAYGHRGQHVSEVGFVEHRRGHAASPRLLDELRQPLRGCRETHDGVRLLEPLELRLGVLCHERTMRVAELRHLAPRRQVVTYDEVELHSAASAAGSVRSTASPFSHASTTSSGTPEMFATAYTPGALSAPQRASWLAYGRPRTSA